MSEKIKIENFIERLNNADFEQGTKFKFLNKIYLYDYPNLVGVYEIGKPTKPEYSIFSQLDMTNLHCEIEILKPISKADEMFKKLGYKIKHKIYNDEVILIGYTKEDEPAEECSIMFLTKKVSINIWADMQELRAINQKCKELQWI